MRAAQADSLAVQGELREPVGGAVATPRDLLLITAGFDAPGVNSGDVTGPDPDLEAARAFFAQHGVSWGLRVPPELPWPHGRLLFRRRMMAMERATFRPAPEVPGLAVRRAGPRDLAAVLYIDSNAFGLDPDVNTRWLEPLLAAARATFALATLDGEPAGTAYTLRSDGAAGPCLYLAGVAVVAEARRRGVGAGISSWLLERGFAAGAELAHLNPDTDIAARLYERLGFTESPGLDIYVDL
ncbi:MAG TPA: GNAT family N-acetyltransferase [Solirubrobacteraceae bacterium]|nr:GNAT family N-acetyltransferase [Solirubrobacteraceae bacterium]